MVSERAAPASEAITDIMPEMIKYAHYLCDTSEQAGELVQKAVEKLLVREQNHGAVDDLKKYLFSILHNLRNDQLRQKQNRQGDVTLEAVNLTDQGPSPQHRLTCLNVLEQINALPRAHREVLRYFIDDNLSYSEISAILGIPEGTVMSRLSRARRALRLAMDMEPQSSIMELLD